MARVAEAVRDSPTALNLCGRSSDLQGWNGGVAGLRLEQSDDREPAQRGDDHSQHGQHADTTPSHDGPFEARGADARADEQPDNGDQHRQADDVEHGTSSTPRFSPVMPCRYDSDPRPVLPYRAISADGGGVHPPICCMSDSRLPTPQWSVILPFCTRITSTDSK